MEFNDLIKLRRTIRFFKNIKVPASEVVKLIDYARFAPSGSNKQPVRYIIIDSDDIAEKIFNITKYAGLVAPRRTPQWGINAPRSFIAVTSPRGGSVADTAAAIENILLGAANNGLGCCWIGAFNKEKASEILQIDENTDIHFLVAVGYPDETPVWDEVSASDSVAYYLDDDDRLHVPKIKTDELITFK